MMRVKTAQCVCALFVCFTLMVAGMFGLARMVAFADEGNQGASAAQESEALEAQANDWEYATSRYARVMSDGFLHVTDETGTQAGVYIGGRLPDILEEIDVLFIDPDVKSLEDIQLVSNPGAPSTPYLQGVWFNRIDNLSKVVFKLDSSGKSSFSSLTYNTDSNGFPRQYTSVFEDNLRLKTVENLEKTQVTAIGNKCFNNCSMLTSIKLPSTCASIGPNAFSNCKALESVSFANVETIDAYAFESCTSLKTIDLPASVDSIGVEAFVKCSSLEKVTMRNTMQVGCLGNSFDNTPVGTAGNKNYFYVPKAVLGKYRSDDSNANSWYEYREKFKPIPVPIDKASVSGLGDKTYTGSAITPKLVVKLNGETLQKDVDYTVSFKNNKAVGTATVTIKGIEAYKGAITKTFNIVKANLSDATIAAIAKQTYTGKAITPNPVVKMGSTTLKKGTDYTVSYENNVKVGTAKVIVTGKGGYTGTATKTFQISKDAAPIGEGVVRLSGNSALDTMSAIVTAGKFPKNGTVVLANAWGYHDALTAAGIAGLYNAPVVMTDGEKLSDQAKKVLQNLKPTRIILCGGKTMISDAVANQAKAAAGASTFVRLSGSNAAGTAVAIYERGDDWADTAIIATSGTYHDALAAAPLSYAKHLPIFMTEWTGALSQETIAAMKSGGITQAYIAGGEYWIPDSTRTQLENAGIKVVRRLSGNTAVETSAAIADEAVGKYKMHADKLGVATTASHYDALAGAAFCGRNESVLLLVSDSNRSSISGFASKHSADEGTAYILGGTSSVSYATEDVLKAVVE